MIKAEIVKPIRIGSGSTVGIYSGPQVKTRNRLF